MGSKRIQPPSPQDDRRGCLCWDTNTYSRECCDGDDYHSQGIGSITGSGLLDLDCSLITLTGFAVSQDGTVTTPTTDIGTITQTSPSSFSIVDVDTERTLTVTIEVPSGYNNLGQTIECTTTATQVLTPTLSCSDITLSGFAVAQDGTITEPTTDIGTISDTSPTSFALVNVSTVRTLSVDITVPSGYYNVGSTITCTTTATQPLTPTLSCSDVTISGFAVSNLGVITLPTVDIGTILSTSPASFDIVSTDTLRTLTVNITVPLGYYNIGDTLVCTTTATQPLLETLSFTPTGTGVDLYLDPISNDSTSTYQITVYADDPITGQTNSEDYSKAIVTFLTGQSNPTQNTDYTFTGSISIYDPTTSSTRIKFTKGSGTANVKWVSPELTGTPPTLNIPPVWTGTGVIFTGDIVGSGVEHNNNQTSFPMIVNDVEGDKIIIKE